MGSNKCNGKASHAGQVWG